ncbi:respiration factor rsf1 [Mactra antiquata]
MATQAENDCLSNPNFAVICSFLDRYGESLSLPEIGYSDLQEYIEDTKNVSPVLIDLHVRLLRRTHKKLSSVTAERWLRGIVKFCHKYSDVDAWELERFGYKLAKTSTKLTLLKTLMESQFDCNNKFKDKVNEIPIEEMRFEPLGRDNTGMAYWYFLDKELNLRVYREHQDDVDSESWELVCRSRDDLAKLISGLDGSDIKQEKQESSDQSEPVSDNNEDSRDSFRQKTPLGPSPLTIKQEPNDASTSNLSGDSKSSIQKLSKCETNSPSKMLKDKFVKEKGSEIQKIMCKMKKEGLVDSDTEDDKNNKSKIKNENDKSDKNEKTHISETKDKNDKDEKIDDKDKSETIDENIENKQMDEKSTSDKMNKTVASETKGENSEYEKMDDSINSEKVGENVHDETIDENNESEKVGENNKAETMEDNDESEKMDEVDGTVGESDVVKDETVQKTSKTKDPANVAKQEENNEISSATETTANEDSDLNGKVCETNKDSELENSELENKEGKDLTLERKESAGETISAIHPEKSIKDETDKSMEEHSSDSNIETDKKDPDQNSSDKKKEAISEKELVKENVSVEVVKPSSNDPKPVLDEKCEEDVKLSKSDSNVKDVHVENIPKPVEVCIESKEIPSSELVVQSLDKQSSKSVPDNQKSKSELENQNSKSENSKKSNEDTKISCSGPTTQADKDNDLEAMESESDVHRDGQKEIPSIENDLVESESKESQNMSDKSINLKNQIIPDTKKENDSDIPESSNKPTEECDKTEIESPKTEENKPSGNLDTNSTNKMTDSVEKNKTCDKEENNITERVVAKSDEKVDINVLDINSLKDRISHETELPSNIKEVEPAAESKTMTIESKALATDKVERSETTSDETKPAEEPACDSENVKADLKDSESEEVDKSDNIEKEKNIEETVEKISASNDGKSSNVRESLSATEEVKTDSDPALQNVQKSIETVENVELVTDKIAETSKEPKAEKVEMPKKARKRKQNEIATTPDSSTDDNEQTELPTKRNIKTVIRRSPNKSDLKDDSVESKGEGEGKVQVENSELVKKTDNIADASDKTVDKNDVRDSHEKESLEKLEEIDNGKDLGTTVEVDQKKDGVSVENNENVKKDFDEKAESEMVVGEKTVDGDNKETSEKLENDNDGENKETNEIIPPVKIKGLVQTRKKSKAQKRQAVDSDEMEPAEPASKKSKLRGRVSSRGRGRQKGAIYDSSSSDDDLPLSQVAGKGRGRTAQKTTKNVGKSKQAPKKSPSKPPPAQVKKPEKKQIEETPVELSEEESGRRRSLRVRNMRARKKSPSPDFIPSELEESEDEYIPVDEDDEDDEFMIKSKKKKRKEPKEVVEEIPKGRNALRHAEKAQSKKEEVEEEEAACVKCLRSHQPEWILLCDKCDAGYHTACLRPPLMIIPDGDWFCPPCEHVMLKEKLEENLKSLDQAILKNDRLVRRKERLAFVSISLDNVLKEPEVQVKPEVRQRKKPNYKESDVESETGSGSSSGSGSSDSTSESESSSERERTRHSTKSSKQKFVQRSCRAKKSVSYRFEEYDELIMDAIEEDLSIPKEPKPRKVKPPGISRGKDMSNILGVSDEEVEKKPVRKRKPRLTELDEDVDDDDTDDYQLSDASNASDVTKSSEPYESEDISDDSIGKSYGKTRRGQRKSRRRGGRSKRFKDFIVDSDFESEDDSRLRPTRGRKQRRKVNYREVNSDETEVEDQDDSFHSSELSDSDFEYKRRKRQQKSKKMEAKERPRSGKRQRIRKVSSSSESTEDESDDSTPKKKKGKKPPSKSARYDSEETQDESDDVTETKKLKSKKFQEHQDESESEAEETEESTESDASEDIKVKKTKIATKKKVVESETEDEGVEEDDDDKKNESHDTNSSCDDESGWEEIGIGSGEEVSSKKAVKKAEEKVVSVNKASTDAEVTNEANIKDDSVDMNSKPTVESNVSKNLDNSINAVSAEQQGTDNVKTTEEEMSSSTEVSPVKMKRGRKAKEALCDSEITEVTPKKRGRKPKPKPAVSEIDVEPLKKKRGRKPKSMSESVPDDDVKDETMNTKEHISDSSEMVDKVPEIKTENIETTESLRSPDDSSVDKNDCSPTFEKGKDDSPLSARNKQNAPVGIVKPEVRQGVIVENKQVIEGRMNENRSGDSAINPLQGMRDLAMGSQSMHGGHESSFTPYSQANYSGPNMQGYGPHQGFHNYHPQGPSYGPPGPPGPGPYPQNMPPSEGSHPRHQSPTSQYHQNQSSMSPNSFQHSGSYMSHMQQNPQGYYPGNYRPQMAGRPDGYGPQGPQGPQSPNYTGQFPPNYPHQGPYGPPRHGYPEHHGPYPIGPQGSMPPQQGQGPYHPGMQYGMQGPPRHGFWGQGSPQGQQPLRPQVRPSQPPQGASPTSRAEGTSEAPNRGFMMDNILKPAPEGNTEVEDSAEVSDIDRYTSFLCKTE